MDLKLQLENKILDYSLMSKDNYVNILKNKSNVLITQNSELYKKIQKLEERNTILLRDQEVIDNQREEIKKLKNEIIKHEKKFLNFEQESGLAGYKKDIEFLLIQKKENERKIEILEMHKQKNIKLQQEIEEKNKLIEQMKQEFENKVSSIQIDNELERKELTKNLLEKLEKDHKDLEIVVEKKVDEVSKLIENQNKKLLFESNCILYKNNQLEKKIEKDKAVYCESRLNEKINKSALEQVITKNVELEKITLFLMKRTKEIIETFKENNDKAIQSDKEHKKIYDEKIKILENEVKLLKTQIICIPEFLRLINSVILDLYNEKKITLNCTESVESDYQMHSTEEMTNNFNLKIFRNLNFQDMSQEDRLNLLVLIMEKITPLIRKSNLFKITNLQEIYNYRLRVFDSDFKIKPKKRTLKHMKDFSTNRIKGFLKENKPIYFKLSNNTKKVFFKDVFKKLTKAFKNDLGFLEQNSNLDMLKNKSDKNYYKEFTLFKNSKEIINEEIMNDSDKNEIKIVDEDANSETDKIKKLSFLNDKNESLNIYKKIPASFAKKDDFLGKDRYSLINTSIINSIPINVKTLLSKNERNNLKVEDLKVDMNSKTNKRLAPIKGVSRSYLF